jgi:hypothetical protein
MTTSARGAEPRRPRAPCKRYISHQTGNRLFPQIGAVMVDLMPARRNEFVTAI